MKPSADYDYVKNLIGSDDTTVRKAVHFVQNYVKNNIRIVQDERIELIGSPSYIAQELQKETDINFTNAKKFVDLFLDIFWKQVDKIFAVKKKKRQKEIHTTIPPSKRGKDRTIIGPSKRDKEILDRISDLMKGSFGGGGGGGIGGGGVGGGGIG